VAERGKGIPVEKMIPDRSGKKIFVLVKVGEEEQGNKAVAVSSFS